MCLLRNLPMKTLWLIYWLFLFSFTGHLPWSYCPTEGAVFSIFPQEASATPQQPAEESPVQPFIPQNSRGFSFTAQSCQNSLCGNSTWFFFLPCCFCLIRLRIDREFPHMQIHSTLCKHRYCLTFGEMNICILLWAFLPGAIWKNWHQSCILYVK